MHPANTPEETMTLVTWEPRLATGYIIVDKQHRNLFDLVNRLHEALLAGKGREEMGPTLMSLAAYTIEHFRMEEGLMTNHKYPGYTDHKRKHDDLVGQVNQLTQDFDAGRLTLPLTLARFLSDWIRHHIDDEDQKMANWIRSKGLV